MKKIKIISLLLAGMTALALVGCGGGSSEGGGGGGGGGGANLPPAQNPVSDVETHYVEGTLHRVNVTPANRPFAVNGATQYKMVMGSEESIVKAGTFIIGHVKGATGAAIELEDGAASWSSSAKYIVVGDSALFAAAGLTMPSYDEIGPTGYYIKTVGDSVFIQAYGSGGYQLGAIAFLREVVGYDMLAADTVIYEKSGDSLPDMEITERPDFDYRQYGNMLSGTGRYGMGYTDMNNIFAPVDGKTYHDSYALLPPEKYYREHPDWYTPSANGESSATATETHQGQLCYTAHGNPVEYELMKQALYTKLKASVDANPTYENITITHEDNYNICGCEACTEITEKYGAASATVLLFVNDIDEMLQNDLENEARENGTIKREMNIIFFAYHATMQAPAAKNADGSYSPVDGIHTNEHVGVLYAPIRAKYSHSFYEEVNTEYAEVMKAWGAVTDKLYCWLYETAFRYYFYPLNTWDTVADTYRFCVENGAAYMYNEGQYDQGAVTHFSRLKEYLDAKLEFDVNADYNALVDKFFKYYYGEAEAPMRKFFDELQSHMRYLEDTYPDKITGFISDPIENVDYWPKRLIESWTELIDEGYAAIAGLKTTNSARYAVLEEHLKLESIFPRYVLCTQHDNMYPDETLLAMRMSFKGDCDALNISHFKEHDEGLLTVLYDAWGI